MKTNVRLSAIGLLLILIGFGMTVFSWTMDTSISVGESYKVMGETFSIPKRVENLGLMNRQQNGIITGCSLLLFGVGLLIFDELSKIRKAGDLSKLKQESIEEKVYSQEKISFICPQCLASLSVDPEHAGKEIQCPSCKDKIKVPL